MIGEKDEKGEDISEIFTLPLKELKEALGKGILDKKTYVFNNLVQTKQEFLTNWVIPLEESWHRKFI